MAMPDALQELIGKTLDDEGIQTFFFAKIVHKLLEVVIKKFEDEDEFSISVDYFT